MINASIIVTCLRCRQNLFFKFGLHSLTAQVMFTAVSRKVVQKKHKSVRDNAERHDGKKSVGVNENMTAMLSKR